jgi:DNA segregation ATPase FtsK/SpoIIIE-like protein
MTMEERAFVPPVEAALPPKSLEVLKQESISLSAEIKAAGETMKAAGVLLAKPDLAAERREKIVPVLNRAISQYADMVSRLEGINTRLVTLVEEKDMQDTMKRALSALRGSLSTPPPARQFFVKSPPVSLLGVDPVSDEQYAQAIAGDIAVVTKAASGLAETGQVPTVDIGAWKETGKALETPLDLSRLRTMKLDPLFLNAAEAILVRGRASGVILQRALGISYKRGGEILDQMTEAGMLGPDSPGGSRDILFNRTDWEAFLGRK